MELNLSSPQDCVGDFTYNFIWQHKGERLKPADIIPSQNGTSYTYEEVVDALKNGEDVRIRGDAGKLLGSSLGVDLVFFGGNGKELPEVGSIIIDGNADSHLGLSMLAGAIYVRGEVQEFQLGKEVGVAELDENDSLLLRELVGEFAYHFSCSAEQILQRKFIKLSPLYLRPYGRLYAY